LTPIHHNSPEILEQRILQFIEHHNETAQPMRWTYTVEQLTKRLATL